MKIVVKLKVVLINSFDKKATYKMSDYILYILFVSNDVAIKKRKASLKTKKMFHLINNIK